MSFKVLCRYFALMKRWSTSPCSEVHSLLTGQQLSDTRRHKHDACLTQHDGRIALQALLLPTYKKLGLLLGRMIGQSQNDGETLDRYHMTLTLLLKWHTACIYLSSTLLVCSRCLLLALQHLLLKGCQLVPEGGLQGCWDWGRIKSLHGSMYTQMTATIAGEGNDDIDAHTACGCLTLMKGNDDIDVHRWWLSYADEGNMTLMQKAHDVEVYMHF